MPTNHFYFFESRIKTMEIINNDIDGIKAAEILQRSFQDDPVTLYVLSFIKDEALRKQFNKRLFQITLGAAIEYEHVITTGKEDHYGVAVWYPPNKHSPSSLYELYSKSFWELPYMLGILATFKLGKEIVIGFELRRNKHMKDKEYYYLQMIGVEPNQQGKGYSKKVMNPILEKADKEKQYCYLESTKKENVPIYEHFGFQVLEEYKVHDTLSVWLMARAPK
ncbi:unnamed protein product [Cunninghamella blakesleeana]